MIELLYYLGVALGTLFVVGVLFVAWVFVVAYVSNRGSSATEEARVSRPVHPNCRSTMVPVSTDGSGPTQTISGTWNSATETSTTRGRSGPHGFRGEDLSDREVDEWLREHGLKGYE